MWHAQITSLTLRFYDQGGYAERTPFRASAQVEFLGDHNVFVHAAVSRDGLPLNRRQWRALADLLRDAFGVKTIEAERHGRRVSWSTTQEILTEPGVLYQKEAPH